MHRLHRPLIAENSAMLLLIKEENDFIIEHSSDTNKLLSYRFSKEQLTENAFTHLQALNSFATKQTTSFLLTEKQDHAFSEVLTKLLLEDDHTYFFEAQLRYTYLTELIHLITKIHHDNLLMFE
jgi:hypothetical protein